MHKYKLKIIIENKDKLTADDLILIRQSLTNSAAGYVPTYPKSLTGEMRIKFCFKTLLSIYLGWIRFKLGSAILGKSLVITTPESQNPVQEDNPNAIKFIKDEDPNSK